MIFSTLIFVIAFLPLFTMRGVEGAIFSPMSHTYAFALGRRDLLAVTLTPVLGSFVFARGHEGDVTTGLATRSRASIMACSCACCDGRA